MKFPIDFDPMATDVVALMLIPDLALRTLHNCSVNFGLINISELCPLIGERRCQGLCGKT
jgi:hypothetical protein